LVQKVQIRKRKLGLFWVVTMDDAPKVEEVLGEGSLSNQGGHKKAWKGRGVLKVMVEKEVVPPKKANMKQMATKGPEKGPRGGNLSGVRTKNR